MVVVVVVMVVVVVVVNTLLARVGIHTVPSSFSATGAEASARPSSSHASQLFRRSSSIKIKYAALTRHAVDLQTVESKIYPPCR